MRVWILPLSMSPNCSLFLLFRGWGWLARPGGSIRSCLLCCHHMSLIALWDESVTSWMMDVWVGWLFLVSVPNQSGCKRRCSPQPWIVHTSPSKAFCFFLLWIPCLVSPPSIWLDLSLPIHPIELLAPLFFLFCSVVPPSPHHPLAPSSDSPSIVGHYPSVSILSQFCQALIWLSPIPQLLFFICCLIWKICFNESFHFFGY